MMLKTKKSTINSEKSLYVKEKIQLLRKEMNDVMTKEPSMDSKVKQKLKKWRENSLLMDDEMFQKRLEAEGIKYDEFIHLLQMKSSLETEESRNPNYSWMQDYEEMMKTPTNHSLKIKNIDDGLYHAFHPFLFWVQNRLESYFKTRNDYLIGNENLIIEKCLESISTDLLKLAARTLALEINVARLLNELEGNSPEERFTNFVETKLKSKNYLYDFYNEYVALARLITIRTAFFVNYVEEALTRLIKDKALINKKFHLQDMQLQSIKFTMGDSHQEGRSVICFQFNNDKEIFYKPKPLAISKAIQDLFQWANEKGLTHPLKTYNMIDQTSYAWEEVVETYPVKNEQELERFYTRFGYILALMYLLKGTDFHYENIIAHGEYPVIIDFETVFHNTIQHIFKDNANTRAKLEVSHSVMGTGLVPLLGFQSKDGKGLEISGMGGKKQELPFPVLQFENKGTDELKLVRKSLFLEESSNRPMLNGNKVDATEYANFVIKGFKEITQIVNHYKNELLAPTGPIDKMKNLKIRTVVRDTYFYANFIIESTHPDYLREAMDRENILDRVFFTTFPPAIVESEKADLLKGDIPYFVTTPSSTSLWNSNGMEIADTFAKSGLDYVVDRIQHLNKQTVQEQINYIKASIFGLKEEVSDKPVHYKKTHIPEKVDPQTFLNEAIKIGDHLVEQAIFGPKQKDASWIGIGMNHQGQWNVSALESGLYDGLGGVALFLGYLGMITDNNKYIKTSKAALTTAIKESTVSNSFPSSFYGPVSLLYPILKLHHLYQDDDEFTQSMNTKLDDIVHYLDNNVEQDKIFDILGGSAGIIHMMLNYYEENGNNKYLSIAEKYGRHLVEHATIKKTGAVWLSSSNDFKALGGFGHGSSGIASALLRLAQVSNNNHFSQMGHQAIAFERSLYNEREGNWIDNRFEDVISSKHYWCHGALGIGMSRLMISEHDPAMAREIRIAVQQVQKNYPSNNHSLCHGDMGAADFLLTAGLAFNDKDMIKNAKELAYQMIHDQAEYLSGAVQQLETPNLFLGLAGIGYELLRLSRPDFVPSVLALQ